MLTLASRLLIAELKYCTLPRYDNPVQEKTRWKCFYYANDRKLGVTITWPMPE